MKDNTPKSFITVNAQMQYNFIHIFSYIAIVLTTIFGLNFTKEVHPFLANMELVIAFVLLLNLFYLHVSKNTNFASSIILLSLGILTLSIYIQGGIEGTGNLWIMIFPLLTFFLKSEGTGHYWLIAFLAVLIAINGSMLMDIIPQVYDKSVIRQTFVVFIVLTLLSYFYNRVKSATQTQMFHAERNMAAILDNMQDTYFRTQLDSSILVVSPSIKQLSGYTAQEVLGTNMLEYYVDPNKRVEFLDELNSNNGKITNFELHFRHKHDLPLWTLVNAQYIYDEDGIVIGVEGTAKDITALKSAQVALEELNESLETRINDGVDKLRQKDKILLQQARMAQMGEMLSMIAHQWRQPLSSITATTTNLKLSIALEEEISNKELNSTLDKIDNHVAFLSSTIDDFRNFFRTNQHPKSTKLITIMGKALEILNLSIINNNIILHQQCEVHDDIKSFENELVQVAINILNNAIDILKEHEQPREIFMHGYQENNMQVLTITDTGGGIDETILPKIFDPYFSTKNEKNGTGLGLYMSKTIVEEHCHGKLEVHNVANGVCFTISLPINEAT